VTPIDEILDAINIVFEGANIYCKAGEVHKNENCNTLGSLPWRVSGHHKFNRCYHLDLKEVKQMKRTKLKYIPYPRFFKPAFFKTF